MHLNGSATSINQSINQSKFIFQAIRNNYNIINVTALERLPEKHYAHGRLNKTRAHHRDEKPERDLTYHLTCLLIYR